MAVKIKELKDKIFKSPFTDEELTQIDKIEKWIDEKLKKDYNGDEVYILLSIAEFKYDPIANISDYAYNPRKQIMKKELEKRYKSAGWKIDTHIDDGLDGPNMSGQDYWILK